MDYGFGIFMGAVALIFFTFLFTSVSFSSYSGVSLEQISVCEKRCSSLGGLEQVYVNGDCDCLDGVEVSGNIKE